jgi:hypothetical protein
VSVIPVATSATLSLIEQNDCHEGGGPPARNGDVGPPPKNERFGRSDLSKEVQVQ